MKTFKITSLRRVQSVRTCSEFTNTQRDKEIRGVTAQIDNFKWHLPLIYTRCIETIWNFWEKIHAFQYTSSHSQNASKLLTEKLPKYSKPRGFREASPPEPLPGFYPGPAGNLKRSSDPSPTFVPVTQNLGSAPDYKQCNLPGDVWMLNIMIIKHKIGLRNIFTFCSITLVFFLI